MKCQSKSVQATLESEGVVVLPPLPEHIFNGALDLYKESVLPFLSIHEFYSSISDLNRERTIELNRKLKQILLEYLELHFEDVRPIVASFIVKPAQAETLVAHQDWTFVDDEPKRSSYNCWIPLVDVKEENGHLGFYKGSHNLFLGYRASPSPQYPRIFPENEETFSKIEYLDMKAGEAVVFNHRVIHTSKPNQTNAFRPAIILAFTSKENRLVHTYLKPNSEKSILQKYMVDEDFFDKYSNNELFEIFESGKELSDYQVKEEIRIQL
jgi:hypothetical protein